MTIINRCTFVYFVTILCLLFKVTSNNGGFLKNPMFVSSSDQWKEGNGQSFEKYEWILFWFFESFVWKINSILHRLTKSFSKSKFFIKATKNMVNSLSANAFPRQSRFPTPNGKNFPLLTLLLPIYFPLESKKRSGINSWAVSPHIFIIRIWEDKN